MKIWLSPGNLPASLNTSATSTVAATAERNMRWVTPDTDIMDYDHTDLTKESNEERSSPWIEGCHISEG